MKETKELQMNYLDPQTVHNIIDKKDTKFATVRFIKADGKTERVINGLFKPTSHIIGNERGAIVSDSLKKNGLIPIWSVADKGWRSFKETQVLEII
tara:strand:+ start:1668 stop:1955 length:288 start_codon:yes stop_codon:yes gene_type:complete